MTAELEPAVAESAEHPRPKPPGKPGLTARTWFLGELLGTFLLVLFGCGSVAASVLLGAQVGLWQVAIVWGIGIALAIHLTSSLSGAHLNPAVTLASWAFAGFPARRIPGYFAAQFLGAFLAAAVVYLLFRPAFATFEAANGITRGAPGSEASAMVFGEFFPNPGGEALLPERLATLSLPQAFLVEAIATAVLVLVILGLTDLNNRSRPEGTTPLFIGLTVTLLISLVAPLTMGCFNPARDLAPRLFSSLAGWGSLPFTLNGNGWFVVYLIGPFVGGLAGGALWRFVLRGAYARAAARPD